MIMIMDVKMKNQKAHSCLLRILTAFERIFN